MTDTILYACNADGDKDLCAKQSTSEIMRLDTMPAPMPKPAEAPLALASSLVSGKTQDALSNVPCDKWRDVQDPSLILHIDAFTRDQFSGAGISQNDVREMLHSKDFTAHEKAQLHTLDKMMPEVSDLFKSPQVNRARIGAAIAWECPERP